MTLGAVMQSASAFVTVQVAFNWFVDNFVRVAEWMASANGVQELVGALEGLDLAITRTILVDLGLSESDMNPLVVRSIEAALREQ
jgi:putative ATP-binding cassette transporter